MIVQAWTLHEYAIVLLKHLIKFRIKLRFQFYVSRRGVRSNRSDLRIEVSSWRKAVPRLQFDRA